MKMLSLDPSSTRTGYALLNSRRELLEAGYLRGKPDDPAMSRICAMVADLVELIAEAQPHRVVVEITSGKVHRRLGKVGAGLAVYGMAVGALYDRAMVAMGDARLVVGIQENLWTRGVPKAKRQRAVAIQFPEYRDRMASDSGGDIADAIGLALWCLDNGR